MFKIRYIYYCGNMQYIYRWKHTITTVIITNPPGFNIDSKRKLHFSLHPYISIIIGKRMYLYIR